MSLINFSNSSYASFGFLNFPCGKELCHRQDESFFSKCIVDLSEGMEDLKTKLDAALPDWFFQIKIDALVVYMESKFNNFYDKCHELGIFKDPNVTEAWYKQLAIHLCKLPLKVAYQIIDRLHCCIKQILQIGAHPLRETIFIGKQILSFIYDLQSSRRQRILGSQILGVSLSQACFTPNLVSLAMVGVGAALLIVGVSKELLDEAFRKGPFDSAIEGFKGQNFLKKFFEVSTTFATAFATGALMSQIPGLNADKVLSHNRRFEIPLVPTNVEMAGIIPVGIPSLGILRN